MKPSLKILSLVILTAFLFLETSFAKQPTKSNTDATAIPVVLKTENFHANDFPKAVKLDGYSHPYRWNRIEGEKIQFDEIWGYVLTDRLHEWDKNTPLTDIGLFAVDVNTYGELEKAPSRKLVAGFKGRVHLVAVCNGAALSHFVLDPQYGLRDKLVRDLIAASREFDGLQIDYENIPKRDAKNFAEFLRLLRRGLGKKMLTVCVHARTRKIENDVEDYERLSKLVDKIMIMAYDEHWSTSGPGSVASMDWCQRVTKYALSILPPEKYIIGAPFYGRSWIVSNNRLAQAWAFNGSNRIMTENNVKKISRQNGVPYFEFEPKVKVIHWYDDATSLVQRCRMYKDAGFSNIAFWRMGHEDVEFWNWIEKSKE